MYAIPWKTGGEGGTPWVCISKVYAIEDSDAEYHYTQNQGGPGSVRFGYGSGVERFKRFRFSVPAVPLQKGFFCISVQFNRKGRFRFRFRFLENGSSGSAFGFGKNGSDGSGSVPEPPCKMITEPNCIIIELISVISAL